jgi:hypothetical protein
VEEYVWRKFWLLIMRCMLTCDLLISKIFSIDAFMLFAVFEIFSLMHAQTEKSVLKSYACNICYTIN